MIIYFQATIRIFSWYASATLIFSISADWPMILRYRFRSAPEYARTRASAGLPRFPFAAQSASPPTVAATQPPPPAASAPGAFFTTVTIDAVDDIRLYRYDAFDYRA